MTEDQIKKHWKTTEDKPQAHHKFHNCNEIAVIQPMAGLKMRPE